MTEKTQNAFANPTLRVGYKDGVGSVDFCDELGIVKLYKKMKIDFEKLPYKKPHELLKAFLNKTNTAQFILYYHGEKITVKDMDVFGDYVRVRPPLWPVKIRPDGSSGEGSFSRERNSIYLSIEETDEPITISTIQEES